MGQTPIPRLYTPPLHLRIICSAGLSDVFWRGISSNAGVVTIDNAGRTLPARYASILTGWRNARGRTSLLASVIISCSFVCYRNA